MFKISALAILTTLDLTLTAQAQTAAGAPELETLATFPHGTFIENLTVAGDGAVTFTSYFDEALLRLAAAGAPATFAKLDVHPIAIVATQSGFLIPAQGKAFTEVQDFTATNQVVELDASGKVTRRFAAPDAVFLNEAAGQGTILLTGGGFALRPLAALTSLGIGKAALRNLAFSLAEELGPRGIRVGTVTILGSVAPCTAFDPASIAEAYWALHQDCSGALGPEFQYKGPAV